MTRLSTLHEQGSAVNPLVQGNLGYKLLIKGAALVALPFCILFVRAQTLYFRIARFNLLLKNRRKLKFFDEVYECFHVCFLAQQY